MPRKKAPSKGEWFWAGQDPAKDKRPAAFSRRKMHGIVEYAPALVGPFNTGDPLVDWTVDFFANSHRKVSEHVRRFPMVARAWLACSQVFDGADRRDRILFTAMLFFSEKQRLQDLSAKQRAYDKRAAARAWYDKMLAGKDPEPQPVGDE